jgi:hypothetical protein
VRQDIKGDAEIEVKLVKEDKGKHTPRNARIEKMDNKNEDEEKKKKKHNKKKRMVRRKGSIRGREGEEYYENEKSRHEGRKGQKSEAGEESRQSVGKEAEKWRK